ncbi:hypothetical protein IKQ19_15865 [Candidatus Saccharibacteria bacterium]|nr:hypothetical protein [Candidatus Saccharibacteria bacterium]
MRKLLVALINVCYILIACSDESGNKSVAPANEKDNADNTMLSFNTYNGLAAEEPCNEGLRGVYAHVNENDADYVCVFDDAMGSWIWTALSNSIGELELNEIQSSSTIFSSSQQSLLSSSSSSSFYNPYYYSSVTTVIKSSSSSKIEAVSSSSAKANWAYLNPAISYGEMQIYLETYKTVTIGSRTWMAEDMYDLGTKCRGYSSKKYSIKGCLFSWEDAMSICPKGWHLPDSADFAELKSLHFDSQRLASRIWKEEYVTYDGEEKTFYGSDDYGFSAVPVGYTTETGLILNTLEGEGSQALFWTSKKVYPSNSGNMRWAFSIHANTRMTGMGFTQLSETCGLAVRCIKDDEW